MSDPICECVLGDSAICEGRNLCDDLGIGGSKTVTVHFQERDHSEESDALIAVSVRMVLDQAERVGGA